MNETNILLSVPKMSVFYHEIHLKSRFAPSPTGYLHRGHVLSAAWVWGMAQATGAKLLLRIEDHDTSRCRPEYVDAIRSDLEWLGFEWDEESRQSEHSERYEESLAKLQSYACSCTRSQVLASSPPTLVDQEPRYPGTCRGRNLERHAGSGLGLRVEMPEASIPWDDLRLGHFDEVPTQQCGDLLARDRLDQWTYQFAVTVDDLVEGIDLVVRGEDLLSSTARQIQLAAMLGRKTSARYLHHPLLCGPDGAKLSKRQLARSIRSEREAGADPRLLLGEVCHAGGLLAAVRPVEPRELGKLIA